MITYIGRIYLLSHNKWGPRENIYIYIYMTDIGAPNNTVVLGKRRRRGRLPLLLPFNGIYLHSVWFKKSNVFWHSDSCELRNLDCLIQLKIDMIFGNEIFFLFLVI
jgi:hypothetical protein